MRAPLTSLVGLDRPDAPMGSPQARIELESQAPSRHTVLPCGYSPLELRKRNTTVCRWMRSPISDRRRWRRNFNAIVRSLQSPAGGAFYGS